MNIIFDLDQTLIDSHRLLPFRERRQWGLVYDKIPEIQVYPGVYELLSGLRSKKSSVCIVTSSPRSYCSRVIRHLKLEIDFSICYHDTTMHKPHPAPILAAISKFSNTDKTVGIGDAANDIIAYKNAKIISIGTLWGSLEKDKLIQTSPDYLCPSVKELWTHLMSIYCNDMCLLDQKYKL